MGDALSKTGKWVDADGRVVDSEPVEGRLLVAPGGPLTPDVKAAIERAESAAPPASDEPDDVETADVETADAPKVETATDKTPTHTATDKGRQNRR